jgi:hypothetical protein
MMPFFEAHRPMLQLGVRRRRRRALRAPAFVAGLSAPQSTLSTLSTQSTQSTLSERCCICRGPPERRNERSERSADWSIVNSSGAQPGLSAEGAPAGPIVPKWECLSGNAQVGMPKWECASGSAQVGVPKWGCQRPPKGASLARGRLIPMPQPHMRSSAQVHGDFVPAEEREQFCETINALRKL